MRISGAGCAEAMVEAIDQILSLAAWIKPSMLPVVSSTNTTSTTGAPTTCWSAGCLMKSGLSKIAPRVDG